MRSGDDFCGPVNLGNPEEISMLELAHTVLELTRSASPVVHVAAPGDDPVRRRPDIALAGMQLDWTPRTALREGLAHTIEWFASLPAGQLRRGAHPVRTHR
jgi:nucleoside-diphosphate-sugar epimerase